MSADEIIASWVPWSTGEAARYRTKMDAAADLRKKLLAAGYAIVPRKPTPEMSEAGQGYRTAKGEWVFMSGAASWKAMIEQFEGDTKP